MSPTVGGYRQYTSRMIGAGRFAPGSELNPFDNPANLGGPLVPPLQGPTAPERLALNLKNQTLQERLTSVAQVVTMATPMAADILAKDPRLAKLSDRILTTLLQDLDPTLTHILSRPALDRALLDCGDTPAFRASREIVFASTQLGIWAVSKDGDSANKAQALQCKLIDIVVTSVGATSNFSQLSSLSSNRTLPKATRAYLSGALTQFNDNPALAGPALAAKKELALGAIDDEVAETSFFNGFPSFGVPGFTTMIDVLSALRDKALVTRNDRLKAAYSLVVRACLPWLEEATMPACPTVVQFLTTEAASTLHRAEDRAEALRIACSLVSLNKQPAARASRGGTTVIGDLRLYETVQTIRSREPITFEVVKAKVLSQFSVKHPSSAA